MSEEQLKAFLEKVKGDTSLQEKLKAAADSDAVLAIAKEAGFSISADDFGNAQSELSEKELESVAGSGGLASVLGICTRGRVGVGCQHNLSALEKRAFGMCNAPSTYKTRPGCPGYAQHMRGK
ncbi:putative SAP domain [Prochlorococcus sp. MIT 0702]|nr:putative SAP domain [Prochlorococcus sp. MIT 0702]KGG26518.1 putative SAP domain [Prochlorococcus sp. MIT 0701]KGG33270.1 putative SAP domain [Prochlorococcus sp. MIT 0703]